MQVAMLFEVCGRQSDIGFNDDPGPPNAFMQYHAASCAAFKAYATPANGFDPTDATVCFDALERMYMNPKTATSAPVKRVLETCHDLDLFRCYGGDRMEDKVKKLAALVVSTDVADLLALSAEQAIAATGDRLMYSRSMDTRQYDAAAFPICSKQPKECLDAIMGVFGPVLSSLRDGISKVLPPTPLVPGESKVRFAGSRFMLLHKAQMAMWKELKWETAEEFEQCNAMLRTLKELLSKYCAAKGVAWVHADGDDGRGKKFFDALVAVARTETKPHRMCERLWTSPETLKHPGGKERELCSIVNDVIRDDDRSNEGSTDSPSLLAPATAFVCMLQFHLNAGRRKKNSHTKWPDGSNSDEKETVFRGSGLPVVHPVTGAPVQGFFRALAGQDQWYRVPHPLATSFRKRVMSTFLGIVHSNEPAMPLVEWTIQFDATKERPPHVNFLDKTEVAGEEELLFSAYSAFRVLEFHPPKSGDGASREDPFRITLEAHYDNAMVSENIPSAPWH